MTTDDGTGEKKSRGSPYDTALKLLRPQSYQQLCAWLGTPLPDHIDVRKEQELEGPRLRVDLVIRLAPTNWLHIEFESRPTTETALRMLLYASRMLHLNPKIRLRQVLVILGPHGDVPETWQRDGIAIRFRVFKLRETDPEPLLACAGTAPFAALGRAANRKKRVRLLARALLVIWHSDCSRDYCRDLMHVAVTLAEIYLSDAQIDSAWEESVLPYARTTLSRYMRNHLGEIIAESKAEGRAEGKAEAAIATLAMLIRRRFGDVPDTDQITTRLAPLGLDAAANAVLDAKTLDELRG
ncbi:hypothetical protein [Fodinicola acaciae]|uniref:hypothetical protein n=1 Tax=Fodinicola acaciae TaxID=2681555 RepID=UPI0013CF9045|nr:hypothetical protein [Fodinicola acaciae]